MTKLTIVCLCLHLAFAAQAQRRLRLFKTADFGKYFVSEMHSPLNKIEIGVGQNYPEYDVSDDNKAYKVFQNTHLGLQIPVVLSKETRSGIQWAASIPVSIHVWWDIFESTTSPILDTDYRFSAMHFNLIKRFSDNAPIRNVSLMVSPYSHESTHIGDELTLYRTQTELGLKRVNVSYEYAEFSVTLNDPDKEETTTQSWRAGLMYRLNGDDGWYSIRPAEGDTTLVRAVSRKWEAYLQYNLIRVNGFLASTKVNNVLSLEIRNRVRYGYPLFVREANEWSALTIDEGSLWSFNAYYGWRVHHGEGIPVGFYLHAYVGGNPYGQFRNIPRHANVGFSIAIR